MSSVTGVCSLYQIVPADKPPHKVATSAAALVPSLSCFSLWKGVSRGRALVVFPVATRNSVPGEEVFKGLAGRFLTELPLENESVEEEDGGQFDEYGEEDEKDYGAGEADELAIANLVLPQPQLLLVDSPEKRGINHLFPSQVGDEEEKLGEDIKLYTAPTTSTSNHTVLSDLITEAMRPRSGRRPWHSSSSIGTSLAAANTVQLFPSKALAQMCGATMKQAASMPKGSDAACHDLQGLLVLMDLDPATARLASSIIGPLLSAYGFLFILRIVMSWYPKTPVSKFPYVVAYAPTEPLLILTRKLIPPLGGVDVTPVVWFGLISFLNEILVGPQGLLVLLSQQV